MADPVPGPESRGLAITLTVKVFAGLREQAGWDERSITLPAGPQAPTPQRLWQLLQIAQPPNQLGSSADAVLSRAGRAESERTAVAGQESPLPEPRLPESVRVAVNQCFAEEDQPLGDGDEVAFLPAISGG